MGDKRGLRRAAGLTQFALARKARVPRSKIADVESGRGEYSPAERGRVATVLAAHIGENLVELDEILTPDVENEKL